MHIPNYLSALLSSLLIGMVELMAGSGKSLTGQATEPFSTDSVVVF